MKCGAGEGLIRVGPSVKHKLEYYKVSRRKKHPTYNKKTEGYLDLSYLA